MPHALSRLSVILLFVLAGADVARAQPSEKTPIQATDVLKIRQLGDVHVSPDRRHVAYTVRQAVRPTDSTYTYRTHLWVASASGRRPPRPMTRGDRSASQPDWHPSGEKIAFVREVEGTPQVFVLPFFGGESYQLTSYEHGARNPRWSPDGERILFSARLPHRAVRQIEGEAPSWNSERPGRSASGPTRAEPDPDGSAREARAWLRQNRRRGDARVTSRLDLQGERDLAPQPRYRHLFVQEADPDAAPRDVTPGFHSFEGGEWMPNGSQIIASSTLNTRRHPDRTRDHDLFLIDVADGTRYRLLDMNGYATFAPRVSPDGQHVAFLARSTNDVGYAQTEVGLYATNGRSSPRLLTESFDRSVRKPRWDPDGWHLYFTAPSEGGFPLYRLPAFGDPSTPQADTLADRAATLDTLRADTLASAARAPSAFDSLRAVAPTDTSRVGARQITADTTGVRAFAVSPGSIYYVLTQVSNPYELYANAPEGTSPRRLTSHNAAWLKNRRLARMTPHTTRNDGRQIDYWTMQPTGFRAGRSYPMLVEIHGGPMAMWGPGEATMWHEFQFLAGKGYGIVFSNPRGSGGYGNAFKRANYRDWGTGPASDVLAAADDALAMQPWLDAERQYVTGGSYASYLTAWLVGHTDRFRAAAAQRGVYDLTTFLGEGNAWRLVPSHFGGYPWGADTTGYAGELVRMPSPTAPPDTAATTDTTRVVVDTATVALDTTAAADSTLIASDTPAVPDSTSLTAADTVALADSTSATRDTTLTMEPASTALPSPADTSHVAGASADSVSLREVLRRNSPFTYVNQIRTPLLIMHASEDLRTGVSQSEMLYRALKILDRPVEYVRYPDAGHDLSRTGDPRQRLDRLLRIWTFFERYAE